MAVLTSITVDMITLVQGNYSHGLVLAWFRKDWFGADTTSGGKLFMKVLDAVDTVHTVDCKRNSIQTFPTDYTSEAGGMVVFSSRPKDPLQDWSVTDTTL